MTTAAPSEGRGGKARRGGPDPCSPWRDVGIMVRRSRAALSCERLFGIGQLEGAVFPRLLMLCPTSLSRYCTGWSSLALMSLLVRGIEDTYRSHAAWQDEWMICCYVVSPGELLYRYERELEQSCSRLGSVRRATTAKVFSKHLPSDEAARRATYS